VLPSPDDLARIARLKSGSLAEAPFATLLLALSSKKRTAVVEVRRLNVTKHILFEEGVPVDCKSNLLHETLGKYLERQGLLDEKVSQRALAESAATGADLGDVLLRLQAIAPFDLFKALQKNLAHKLLDMFTWPDGEFHVQGEVPETASSLRVNVPQLVFTGLVRFAPIEQVNAGIGTLVGHALGLDPSSKVTLDELRLSAKHARIGLGLKRRARIDELQAQAAVPADEVARVLYALAVLGVVRPAQLLPEPASDSRLTPRPMQRIPPDERSMSDISAVSAATIAAAPSSPAATGRPHAAQVKLRDDVMQLYLGYRKKDAFDFLGVGETSTIDDARQAYLAFIEKHAPWTFVEVELAPLRDKAEELVSAAALSLAILVDPNMRSASIARRREREKQAPPPPAPAPELVDADATFKKGKTLAAERRFGEAVKLLEQAADIDPQNAVYRCEASYCRFLHTPALVGVVIRDLVDTMRMDPRCGLAAYYAGECARSVGDVATAEAFYRRAQQLMGSSDGRPAAGLRAMGR
jgi:hypothetical protein